MTASDTPENSASFLAVMARPSSAAASRRWQVARSAGLMSSSATGNGLSLRSVDGLHVAVGDSGVQDPGHQGALIAQVRHILGAARGFFIGVHTGDAFADAFTHQASLLF